jgi:hypothetical protein
VLTSARVRVTDEAVVSVGERTWRLPVGQRVLDIAFQAMFPLLAAVFVGLPPGSSPGPVSWAVVAAIALVCLSLARRSWLESVTLTADALIIRNVFTSRRIFLADIAGVTVRRNGLRVTEAGAPAPTGRHVGGPSRVVGAVRPGGAYWTGRRTEADAVAEAIAAGAGLPPPGPRRVILSRGTARFGLAAGLVIDGLGVFLGPLHADNVRLPIDVVSLAAPLISLGTFVLIPAASAVLDYRRGRS